MRIEERFPSTDPLEKAPTVSSSSSSSRTTWPCVSWNLLLVALIGLVFVFVLGTFIRVFMLPSSLLSSSPSSLGREGFRVNLGPYFTERQGGFVVEVTIDYTYDGLMARALMPDYREIQIMTEDLLYGARPIDIFWELVNRELVRRILLTYPQFPDVQSSFRVFPRNYLVITRASEVRWSQGELPALGMEANFRKFNYFLFLLNPNKINILVPRCFVDSVVGLMNRWQQDPSIPFLIDISLHQLEGGPALLRDALRLAGPNEPYSFIVLPSGAAPPGWFRGPQVTTLQSWNLVFNPQARNNQTVISSGLAAFLGLNSTTFNQTSLLRARESFFVGDFGRTIYPSIYTVSYQALGWPMISYGTNVPLYAFSHPNKIPDSSTLASLQQALAQGNGS